MCSRLACVEVVGVCVLFGAGTAIEFVWDHGGDVRISLGGICADWPPPPPLFCHARVESGADAIRVTFYSTRKNRKLV